MNRLLKVYRNRNYIWPNSSIPPGPKEKIVPLGFENLEELRNLRSPRLLAAFRKFLAAGRYGILLMVDGIPVGHAWVTRPHSHERIVNNYARLKTGESLIHYCYVDPKHRGRGYYSEMLHAVTLWALQQGATSVRVDTDEANTPSQHGILRAGFEETEATISIVAGRWLLWSNRK